MQNRAHQPKSLQPEASSSTNAGRETRPIQPTGQPPLGFMERLLLSPPLQYGLAFALFAIVSLLNIWLEKLIGYQAIALVYLLAVVVLALFVSRGPILFGTALTAFGWGYLAPPSFSFQITSFYDKMMVVTYFVVALTIGQLTTLLRAHREAEIKGRLVAESERLSRTLLNSVSHELRTPLAVITSAANELQASEDLNERQKLLTVEIESASVRLNQLVQSLLSAARIKSGQVRPKLDWCDASDLVRTAVQKSGRAAEGRPIVIKLEPGLRLVKLDFVLMEQALTNLLLNAIRHTPTGTEIEIGARIEGKELIFTVADRGPGIAPDQLGRIFDSFHQAPGAPSGGTGLGLAIVKGFVEAQGGRVAVANRTGGGALFIIRMPAVDKVELPEETL